MINLKRVFFLIALVFISSCNDDSSNEIALADYDYIFEFENRSYKNTELKSEYVSFDESTRTLTNKLTFNFSRNISVYNGPLEISIIPNSGREIENYTFRIYSEDNSEILPGFEETYPIIEENKFTFFYDIILDENFDSNITDLGFPALSIEVSAVDSDILWHNRISFGTHLKLEE